MALDDRFYEDRTVRLTDLIGADPVLDGFTFIGCNVHGPAVILPRNTIFARNSFGSPDPDALFWEISPKRASSVGAVEVVNCTFERCRFSKVGIAGPKRLIAHLRGSIASA